MEGADGVRRTRVRRAQARRGYVGFKHFVATADGRVVLEPLDHRDTSDAKEQMERMGQRIDFLNLMKATCEGEAPSL